jgi:acetyl esterase/lipase
MAEQSAGRVSIERGVVIGEGGGRELRADVYTPPAGSANGAGVLLIHGGGWVQGDRSQLRGYGILLGRVGYTSVACEYRLAPGSRWPAQIHDVKAALRWMRANAATFGIDPGKIAVSGNSAGGHLAMMLAGTQQMAEFEGDGGNAGAGTGVAACIAYYGPALLFAPGALLSDAVRALLGRDATEEHARAASPLTYAEAMPPTLLITGNKDELVPEEAAIRMYRAIADAGGKAELHVYEGAPHAFDALPSFGRQTAEIMRLFLDRHVVNPRPIAVPQSRGAAAG